MPTPKTQDCYKHRALQLIRRAKNESGEINLTSLQIAQWLIDNKNNYSKATWRQYRASLIYFFSQHALDSSVTSDDVTIVATIALLKDTYPPADRPPQRKTSAQKQKKINDADLICLLDYFNNKLSKHGQSTIAWLFAGLFTGLRPCEWKNTTINKVSELQVINAKTTQGRSHGSNRIIHLTELSQQEKDIIQIHLNNIQQVQSTEKENQSEFELFYQNCRACLYEATRALWPNRKQYITLYSARHQFAANAKFSGLPLEHIAALMGHASIETATQHYGRRSAGNARMKISANSDDVGRVMLLNEHRMDHKQLASLRPPN